MAFKSIIAVAAVALLAAAPLPPTYALSIAGAHGDAHLLSRVPHSSLIRRGKRCPKLRTGETVKTTPKPPPTPKPVARPKLGIIYPSDNPQFYSQTKNAVGRIFGTYNWTPYKPDGVSSDDFIPTLKADGAGWDHVTSGFAKRAFGCNEVNQPGQSLMSVGQGVSLWKSKMSPLRKKGYQLYSHSVSNAPSGLKWLKEFESQCRSCMSEIAAMNVHVYNDNAEYSINYIKSVHDAFPNKKLVISEMACANFGDGDVGEGCGQSGVQEYINKFVGFLNSQPYVIGYFYFGAWTPGNPSGNVPSANALYNGNGTFTSNGKAYFY